MTLKKIGDDIRARLKAAQASGELPGEGCVSYDVRASNGKDGGRVNITVIYYQSLIPGLGKPVQHEHGR